MTSLLEPPFKSILLIEAESQQYETWFSFLLSAVQVETNPGADSALSYTNWYPDLNFLHLKQ